MTQAEFETRIIAMQDTLYRVSATLLTQMCDREDAIQECIYKALAKREKLKSDDAMQAWVVRILINECYQQMRRRKRLIPMETPPEGEVEPGADADVRQALMRLPFFLQINIKKKSCSEASSGSRLSQEYSLPAHKRRSVLLLLWRQPHT